MAIDKPALKRMLVRVVRLWRDNSGELSAIDSRFGDGDHGVTIGKIADVLENKSTAWADDDMARFLADTAEAILAVPGGSAGPLYGTFFEGLAEVVPHGAASVDAHLLKLMLASALANLQSITKAKIGDKTMMDAIIPAVEAASAADGDEAAVLAAAADAAAKGAEASRQFVARFGRARSYGDATLGTPDVGALSSSLLFRGLSDGFSA